VPVKQRFTKPRKPQFSEELLALFVELNNIPKRKRRSQQFKDGERKLAEMLGFDAVTAWWGGAFCVVDAYDLNFFQPWHGGYKYWQDCKKIREDLLAATRAPLHNGLDQS
jgi:hypothetical protein